MREAKSKGMAVQHAMTRRAMLQALAALAASGVVPQALAQGAIPPAQFAMLSKSIAGYAFADKRVAAAMLDALASAVGATNLARLAKLVAATPPAQLGAALKDANLETTAETVVAALYTGSVTTPRGVRVISYDNALVWQALAWTKPNAFCGGQTNYWAAAPATTS